MDREFFGWLDSASDGELADRKQRLVELLETLRDADVRTEANRMVREIEHEQLARTAVKRVRRGKRA